jgi:hypothetical protein
MPGALLSSVFANPAGELSTHPGGYAVLRYRAGANTVAPLSDLLTRMAALLVARGWNHLLSNALELPPFSAEAWMVTQ